MCPGLFSPPEAGAYSFPFSILKMKDKSCPVVRNHLSQIEIDDPSVSGSATGRVGGSDLNDNAIL